MPQSYIAVIAAVEELISLGHKADGALQSADSSPGATLAANTSGNALEELIAGVKALEAAYRQAKL